MVSCFAFSLSALLCTWFGSLRFARSSVLQWELLPPHWLPTTMSSIYLANIMRIVGENWNERWQAIWDSQVALAAFPHCLHSILPTAIRTSTLGSRSCCAMLLLIASAR